MSLPLKYVSPERIEKALIHRCDVYHINSNPQPKTYGVQTKGNFKYSDVPDLTDVSCYFDLIENRLPDTDDAHPNRIKYNIYSVIFRQDCPVKVNDKVLYDGNVYVLGEPQKLHTVAWEVIAIRQEDL